MQVYFGEFSGYQQMLNEWGDKTNLPIPAEEEVLFASYGTKNYEGEALVIFKHAGKLYEVNGSHCSCYGLSESSYSGRSASQWKPEETSWEALAMRNLGGDYSQFEPEAVAAFKALIDSKGLKRKNR